MRTQKSFFLIPTLTFVLVMALAAADGGQIRSEEFAGDQSADWTPADALGPLLSQRSEPVTLQALLVETLLSSPAIAASRHAVGIEYEQIVSQDAAFDSRLVLSGGYGLTNDPVGNTLVTGGPPRLRERSWDASGGIVRDTRTGANWNLTQDLGLLDSNSQFFAPADQGDARLNLALTQPLLAGRGRLYNTRLVVQARIDASTAWEQMRADVTSRLAQVTQTYLELHEHRCHAAAQADLIRRAESIQTVIRGRTDFDVGRLGLAKTEARIGSRRDRLITDLSDVARTQAQLRALIGVNGGAKTDALANFSGSIDPNSVFLSGDVEWIPEAPPTLPHARVDVAIAVATAMQYRPEIKSAMQEIQSSALGIRVTENQLMPRLDAVLNGYLSGLNGDNDAVRSFGDQFTESGPGVSALLQYELPNGNRAARARHREAMHRYRQATFELESVIVDIRGQIESALIAIEAAHQLRQSKRRTLIAASEEEYVLTKRFEAFGPDGGNGGGGGAAILLESLLEAQQRRTDAIRVLVSAEIAYHTTSAQLQRAMGTVLLSNNITPIRSGANTGVEFAYPSLDKNIESAETPISSASDPAGVLVGGLIESDQIEDSPLTDSPLTDSPLTDSPSTDSRTDQRSGAEPQRKRGQISIPFEIDGLDLGKDAA